MIGQSKASIGTINAPPCSPDSASSPKEHLLRHRERLRARDKGNDGNTVGLPRRDTRASHHKVIRIVVEVAIRRRSEEIRRAYACRPHLPKERRQRSDGNDDARLAPRAGTDRHEGDGERGPTEDQKIEG